MAKRKKVSHARLTTLLDYNPSTGIFRWKVQQSLRIHIDDVAGVTTGFGHRRIQVDGRKYAAHQLGWFYVHGRWPHRLDHRNRVPDDNRLENLRIATPSQNGCNSRPYSSNTSGFRGTFRDGGGRWRAQIRVGGKVIYLGLFDTPQEAHAAYCAAATRFHGEFARR